MRIGILADTHGNGPAFERILQDMGAVDLYIGLGDYLWPSAGSFALVDWMQANEERAIFIRGNHDRYADQRRHMASWRRDPSSLFDYVEALPQEVRVTIEGHRLFLRHDYPVHPRFAATAEMERPLDPTVNLQLLRRSYIEHYLDLSDADIFLWGGYHLPYLEIHEDLILHNPGAAGLTVDQARLQVSYSILTLERGGVTVDHRRLPVPLDAVISDVAAGYHGPAAESWLVMQMQGMSRIRTRDWKTHWGTVRIPRGPAGRYQVPEGLWNLQNQTPQPSL